MRKLLSVNNPTKEELAWMAGIIDGEGSIFSTFQGNNPRFRVSVETTDRIIVPHFVDLFGKGKIRDCASRNDNARASKKWEISSKQDVTELLSSIIPYLTVKKPHAVLAITGTNSSNSILKTACAVSLKILNLRGK